MNYLKGRLASKKVRAKIPSQQPFNLKKKQEEEKPNAAA